MPDVQARVGKYRYERVSDEQIMGASHLVPTDGRYLSLFVYTCGLWGCAARPRPLAKLQDVPFLRAGHPPKPSYQQTAIQHRRRHPNHRRDTEPPRELRQSRSHSILHPQARRHGAHTMASFRRFRPDDVNKFSKCNLDPLTETYELGFYLQYYTKWPSLFQVCEDMDGNIVGYSEQRLIFATQQRQMANRLRQSWARSSRLRMLTSIRSIIYRGMRTSQRSRWPPKPAAWVLAES